MNQPCRPPSGLNRELARNPADSWTLLFRRRNVRADGRRYEPDAEGAKGAEICDRVFLIFSATSAFSAFRFRSFAANPILWFESAAGLRRRPQSFFFRAFRTFRGSLPLVRRRKHRGRDNHEEHERNDIAKRGRGDKNSL